MIPQQQRYILRRKNERLNKKRDAAEIVHWLRRFATNK